MCSSFAASNKEMNGNSLWTGKLRRQIIVRQKEVEEQLAEGRRSGEYGAGMTKKHLCGHMESSTALILTFKIGGASELYHVYQMSGYERTQIGNCLYTLPE